MALCILRVSLTQSFHWVAEPVNRVTRLRMNINRPLPIESMIQENWEMAGPIETRH